MKKLMAYKFTVLAVIVVLVLVLMPGSDVPSVSIPHIDKLVHFCMFGGVNFCFQIEYRSLHKKLSKFWLVVAYLVIFAAFTEIMQYFVPGRSCDILDLMADTCGILAIGGGIVYYLKSR